MLNPGDSFGDYKVVRLLGKGGMGSVFLLQTADGRQVAAKILDASSDDHKSRKRFLREAELALGVKHPNLVEVYDVGEDPDTGLCYILMEYVSGGTLADYIKKHGALSIEDAVSVVQAMAGVLELARQKGIVHRDIKPANIMFDAEGTPKLADLGIARGGAAGVETTTVTQTGVMIGTPAYMAPEQMLDAHNVDTRADIYSLGVVFFEMLTGERPNKDDTVVQLMAKAVKGEPLPDVRTLRPEISASLAQLLAMMVAPDKEGRISTPGQITNALGIIERGGKLVDAVSTPRQGKDMANSIRRGGDSASTAGRAFPWKILIPVAIFVALAAVCVLFAPKKASEASSSILKTGVRAHVAERTVVQTNVVEKIVEKNSGGRMREMETYRSPYSLKKISTLGPNTQKRLQDMGSRRRSGQRRGVMVFGTLRVDDKYSGKDVASLAWLGQNGWFSADIWPSEYDHVGGAYVGGGHRLVFLKHGYEPVELDLSREADREWSDAEAYDLGVLNMRRLREDRQCAFALTVDLPSGVREASVGLFISNRRFCGDCGTDSQLQKPRVKVLERRMKTGEQLQIDGCTPTTYEIVVSAPGCASVRKTVDLSDATQRKLTKVTLLRAREAHFALRPFVGGAWVEKSVLVDNEQKLVFNDGSVRHSLNLVSCEGVQGLSVSSVRGGSSYDDYGELTPDMFDRQSEKGALARPVPLAPRESGLVTFHSGRIYRFRNSGHPIDTLIAFRGMGGLSERQVAGSQDGLDAAKPYVKEGGSQLQSALGGLTTELTHFRAGGCLRTPAAAENRTRRGMWKSISAGRIAFARTRNRAVILACS